MKWLICLFVVIILPGAGFSQGPLRINALKRDLAVAKQDTSCVLTLSELCGAYSQTNFDSAIVYGERGLALARKIKFSRGEIWALTGLGGTYMNQGDIPKALQKQLEAQQIAEKTHYIVEEAQSLKEIGFIYNYLKDYPQALTYDLKASQILKNCNSEEVVDDLKTNVDLNIGANYMLNNQLDSANIFLEKIYKETMNSYWHPIALRYFGELQFRLGNSKAAIEYLRESVKINKKNGDVYSSAQANNTMAGFFDELKQPDSCIYYAKTGLDDGLKIGYKKAILEASNLLSKQFEALNDVTHAFYYQKIARSMNDELYGAKKVLELQKTLSDQQQSQSANEIEKIGRQNQLKQYALLAGLSITLLTGLFLYRNNRLKQKANALLHSQKEEIDVQRNKAENALSDLKAAQSQLVQSEKMASLGQLTAGIAHEIQNPLNFVNNFAEVSAELAQELKEEIAKAELPAVRKGSIDDLVADLIQNQQKINFHGKRADSIVKGMLQHSRSAAGVKAPTDLNRLADEYLRLSFQGLRGKDKTFNAALETRWDESLPAVGLVAQDVGRVLVNIFTNAFYSVMKKKKETAGDFQPTVGVVTEKKGNFAEIRIRDNGLGVPLNVVEKIFNPFFTTKPAGEGTGLGLSLSYEIIVKEHGGSLQVESKEGEFAEFIIRLPI